LNDLIKICDGVRILTRKGYEAAIRKHFDDARADQVAAAKHLRAVHFRALALERFDRSAPKYGPLNLDGRDWPVEAAEEDVDGIAYRIIRRTQLLGL